jgi:prevent-host-death family protein
MNMKEIGAAEFRKHCLSILDEVDENGLVITKRGKPVAKLMDPADELPLAR